MLCRATHIYLKGQIYLYIWLHKCICIFDSEIEKTPNEIGHKYRDKEKDELKGNRSQIPEWRKRSRKRTKTTFSYIIITILYVYKYPQV